jgi:hypothetical protein
VQVETSKTKELQSQRGNKIKDEETEGKDKREHANLKG